MTTYTPTNYAYDYAIGGKPFLSAVHPEAPYLRETAPFRKEQLDTSPEVGEQSLAFWWLKSQSSFHGGAGQKYFDTPFNEDPLRPFKFDSSKGVNVWTPGQLTLLKSAVNVGPSDPADVQRMLVGEGNGVKLIFHSTNATLTKKTVIGASENYAWGGTNNILSMADSGGLIYIADRGGVYKGGMAETSATKVWDWSATPNDKVHIAWVKQRLMAGVGRSIYELAPDPATPPSNLPTAKYTHPNSQWQWTAIVEGPNAIYASGYAGAVSAIYKFALTDAGEVPTLTSGVTVAEMPPGEQVHTLYPYLGSLMGIGTSKGLRVARFESGSGNFTYGPLVFETAAPVRAMAGHDRFLFVGVTKGVDNGASLYRVDLSLETAPGVFPYATDLYRASWDGEVWGVGMFGNRPAFVVDGTGVANPSGALIIESDTLLMASGTLNTSRHRFSTAEPKLVKYVRLRAAPLIGSIEVRGSGGAMGLLHTYSTQGEVDLPEQAVTASPHEYAALTFVLRPQGNTTGPEMNSYQIKALPAGKRQRLIRLPLLCFDRERDRTGQQLGSLGGALTRVKELEAMEEAGDVVTFQEFRNGQVDSRSVVIDEVRFAQGDPPTNADGWGGVLLVTLRTVD